MTHRPFLVVSSASFVLSVLALYSTNNASEIGPMLSVMLPVGFALLVVMVAVRRFRSPEAARA